MAAPFCLDAASLPLLLPLFDVSCATGGGGWSWMNLSRYWWLSQRMRWYCRLLPNFPDCGTAFSARVTEARKAEEKAESTSSRRSERRFLLPYAGLRFALHLLTKGFFFPH